VGDQPRVPDVTPRAESALACSAAHLAFVVSEDWYFCSHRLPLAVAALAAGYRVSVITRVGEHGELMRRAGLNVVPFLMSRSGINPIHELRTVDELRRLYLNLKPDIVHHVALKPVVLGSIAARLAKVPRVINAVAGLGYLSISSGFRARALRHLLRVLLRFLLRYPGTTVIVQNEFDAQAMRDLGLADSKLSVIRGAGVDLAWQSVHAEAEGTPVVMLAARLLWDKGVGDFVEAARILNARGVVARFVLVGRPDAGNPRAVPVKQLEQWRSEGPVEWWGHSADMNATLARCHVFCLPTFYGEGIPKVLLEAAAAGRPIVASDIPGCREVVRPDVNGLLVPQRNPQRLAEALQALIEDPARRRRLGVAGRRIAEEEFSVEKVIAATLALYVRPGPASHAEGRA